MLAIPTILYLNRARKVKFEKETYSLTLKTLSCIIYSVDCTLDGATVQVYKNF